MNCFKYATICLAVLCFSCKGKQHASGDHPVLKVELKEKPVSVPDIFKSAEIIPLQTSEESLFSRIEKVEIHGDTIFVFSQYSVFMFDPEGRYINKIQRIGRGPGEYTMAYDFNLDPSHKTISLLNPMGAIMIYDSDGNFIKKGVLPNPPPSYAYFEMLDRDTYVTWSLAAAAPDDPGVNIIDAGTFEIERGFFPFASIGAGFAGSVFHKFDGETYYHERMGNKVYRLHPDMYETAYEWDTGVRIIDPNVLTDPYYTTSEGRRMLSDKDRSGEIPFVFRSQMQSKKFYYAALSIKIVTTKNLFYEKKTGNSFYFEKTTEGIDLNLIHMGDDYAIGIIRDMNTEGLQKVVSPENAELLRSRKEDDNLWLVKYTFK